MTSGKRFFSSSSNNINSKDFEFNYFNLNNKPNQCKAIIKSKKSKLYNSRCTYKAKFDNFCGKHKNYNVVINIKQTNLQSKCIGLNKKGLQCGRLTFDSYCFYHIKNSLLNKTDSFKNEFFNAKMLDQFYTNQSLVNFCVHAYNSCVQINKDKDIFIEPSAGSGAFISSINRMCNNRVFIDIDPKHTSIKKTDFLDFNENFDSFSKIHIIGNPPFKLISKFIKKSSQIGDVIGFILPLSFRKESRKRLFPLNFHCIYDTILPTSYFFFGKSIFKIPTVFQIWEKQKYKRKLPVKITSKYIKFVKKKDNPTLAFKRVGAKSGEISIAIEEATESSHYFIKLVNGLDISKFFEIYTKISFCHENIVGPKSISQQELLFKLNQHGI